MELTTLVQVAGLFNIFVGVMLTLSILLMGAAIIVWLVRLGTTPTYRDQAIEMMQWAVALLFTLIILVFLSQFIQRHTAAAVFVIGFVIVGVIAWLIFKVSSEAPAHKEEEE